MKSTTSRSRKPWSKYYLIPLVSLALVSTFKLPSLAQLITAGTPINNTANGSFENPNDPGTVIPVESNTVTLTISEVAGINVSTVNTPEEAPAADVVNDGPGQGDSVIGSDDIVYFTYRITNTGNDQTQFFIPGAPSSVTNADFQAANPIEIVSYFDGTTTTPLNIDVPANGDTSGTLFTDAGVVPSGSVPVGGHIDVRIPVKANSNLTPGVSIIEVVLGDTPAVGDQNIEFTGTFPNTGNNDVTTFDNPGTTNGDLAGSPASERESSISQQTGIGAANLDYGDAPDITDGPVAGVGLALGDYESAPGRGPSHVVGSISLGGTVDAETTFSEDDGPPLEDDGVVVGTTATDPSLHGQSFVAGEEYTLSVTTVGDGNLSVWIDFNRNGSFDDAGEQVVVDRPSTAGFATLPPIEIPIGASGGATYTRVRYSSVENLTSTNAAPDGEVEDYAINIDPAAPALRLVKRVTRVGGTNFGTVVDDTNDTADDSANWPADPYLAGQIAAPAEPGEEVDYTVYFLSDGNTPISNIKICDLIPANTGYVPNSLRVKLGNDAEQTLSDASGAEAVATGAVGEKFGDGAEPTNSPCPTPGAGMDEGGVYVEVSGVAENATSSGSPDSSFGYIRFTVQVD